MSFLTNARLNLRPAAFPPPSVCGSGEYTLVHVLFLCAHLGLTAMTECRANKGRSLMLGRNERGDTRTWTGPCGRTRLTLLIPLFSIRRWRTVSYAIIIDVDFVVSFSVFVNVPVLAVIIVYVHRCSAVPLGLVAPARSRCIEVKDGKRVRTRDVDGREDDVGYERAGRRVGPTVALSSVGTVVRM